ncbi:hypothetical protein ACSFA8_10870 [Variovorax sp. RT4R15]|uniref:hypothetical protein n=1 Tax=Variovorax sp. RT4R15 TaxID=3443737 RepID=UPI003F453CAD
MYYEIESTQTRILGSMHFFPEGEIMPAWVDAAYGWAEQVWFEHNVAEFIPLMAPHSAADPVSRMSASMCCIPSSQASGALGSLSAETMAFSKLCRPARTLDGCSRCHIARIWPARNNSESGVCCIPRTIAASAAGIPADWPMGHWALRSQPFRRTTALMQQISASLGVPLGALVDLELYDRVAALSWKALPDINHAKLFGVGWTGLGYRARAAGDRWSAFQEAFPRPETSETHYMQEVTLFDFVANACAAVETIVFSSFIVARSSLSADIADSELRAGQRQMVDTVARTPATLSLGRFLSDERNHSAREKLFELRDVLLHRGRVPRYIWVSIGGPGDDDGRTTFPANPKSAPQLWRADWRFNAAALDPIATWLRDHIGTASRHLVDVLHGAQHG